MEFWDAVDNQFLGVIKLSFSKIYQGFLLEGRLNEIAVKTSLLPTAIHKGHTNVTNLSNQVCGNCNLQAFIGTTAQIQSHISNPKPNVAFEPVANEEKQVEIEPKKRIDRSKGTLKDLTELLWAIDTHEKASLLSLSLFAGNKEGTHQ